MYIIYNSCVKIVQKQLKFHDLKYLKLNSTSYLRIYVIFMAVSFDLCVIYMLHDQE